MAFRPGERARWRSNSFAEIFEAELRAARPDMLLSRESLASVNGNWFQQGGLEAEIASLLREHYGIELTEAPPSMQTGIHHTVRIGSEPVLFAMTILAGSPELRPGDVRVNWKTVGR